MKMFLLLMAAGFLALAPANGQAPTDSFLLAGAGKEKITPMVETFNDQNKNGEYDSGEPFVDLNQDGKWNPVWLAGYQSGRFALGVRDELWARSLILSKDRNEILLISLDLIGYLFDEVSDLKKEIAKNWNIPEDHILIASTHDHSGPDTIGLWGKNGSGKNEEYLEFLNRQVHKSVEQAVESMQPARLYFGKIRYPNPIDDARPPRVVNDLLLSLRAVDLQGQTIATAVNYAMHAEVLNGRNRLVTSDYPGVLREELEKQYGGVALFFAGDIGGMQTPKALFHTFRKCRQVGRGIARKVIQSLERANEQMAPNISVKARRILFPIENPRFVGAIEKGLFGNSEKLLVRKNENLFLPADIAFVQLGPAQIQTVPGELFPELGNVLRGKMNAEYPFLIGLCNNEIGYIVPASEWNPNGYEESMSLGPRTSEILLSEFLKF